MDIAAEVAKKLLQINAIKLSPQSPFTWASGLRSPIYCDNRMVLSYPGIRKYIISCFAEQAKALGNFGQVAGVATAGIAHGALLASQLDLPFLYVRSKAKGHGRQNQIEGLLDTQKPALVIEDLISTGGSSLKAVEALQQEGGSVRAVMAIFTYGLKGATEAFSKAQIPLVTLSDYETLVEVARQQAYIDADQVEALQAWRKDPKAWSLQHSA